MSAHEIGSILNLLEGVNINQGGHEVIEVNLRGRLLPEDVLNTGDFCCKLLDELHI